jgi:uncharacterized protein
MLGESMSEPKPEINYPCSWAYRVIGTDAVPMKNAIESIVSKKRYELKDSNQSSGGKYTSMALSLVVDSEEERLSIFDSLKASDEIRMVL